MPTITFTLSASDLTRTVTALAARYGYPGYLAGVPSGQTPLTQSEYVRQAIAGYIKREVQEHEQMAARAAAAAAITPPDVT